MTTAPSKSTAPGRRKSSGKLTTSASKNPVPQSQEEANLAILEIGAASRELLKIESQMNTQITLAKTSAEEEAKQHKATIKSLTAGVQTWAEANRKALTNDGKTKTAKLPAGTISWRLKPATVRITKAKIDDIIKAIRVMRKRAWLREKVEIDKEAMLKEKDIAAQLDGVTIGSEGETFTIEPAGLELAPETEAA